MYDLAGYVAALNRILEIVEVPSSGESVLVELSASVRELFDLAGAAILLIRDEELTVTVADAPVAALERAQERSQRGPACQAARDGAVVAVPTLSGSRGCWPEYTAAAARVGIAATAAIPLRAGQQTMGCLDLHSATVRSWCPDDLDAVGVLARLVAAHCAADAALRHCEQVAEQLQHALRSRVVIEQAKGILAGGGALTVDQAFDRLRRYARRNRTSVHSVAQAVVAGHLQDRTATGNDT